MGAVDPFLPPLPDRAVRVIVPRVHGPAGPVHFPEQAALFFFDVLNTFPQHREDTLLLCSNRRRGSPYIQAGPATPKSVFDGCRPFQD